MRDKQNRIDARELERKKPNWVGIECVNIKRWMGGQTMSDKTNRRTENE